LGLLWYRFSDEWQKILSPQESSENYWVNVFNLRPPSYEVTRESAFTFDQNTESLNSLKRVLFRGEDWDFPN
jgi:hypothetical protein